MPSANARCCNGSQEDQEELRNSHLPVSKTSLRIHKREESFTFFGGAVVFDAFIRSSSAFLLSSSAFTISLYSSDQDF